MKANLPSEQLAKVKALVMDVDGVLTDGGIWLGDDGEWRRKFSMLDGLGIKALLKAGYKVGWITGSNSKDIRARAEMLGVKFVSQNQDQKQTAFEAFLTEHKLQANEVAYIGDDLPDLPLLKNAGVSVTVPNAIEEVLNTADIVTKRPGGSGAVRELCDLILRSGAFR